MSTPLTTAALQQWSQRLRTLVAECTRQETAISDRHTHERKDELRAYTEARQQATAAFDGEAQAIAENAQQTWQEATTHWSQQLTNVELTTRSSIAEVERRFETERDAAQASRDETTWLVGSLLDEEASDSPRQQLQRLHAQIDGTETLLQEAVRSAEDQRKQATAYLERCRMSTEMGLSEPAQPPHTLAAIQERCLEEVEQVKQPYRVLQSLWLPRLFRGITPAFLWLLLTAAVGGPTYFLLEPRMLGIEGSSQDIAWISILAISSGATAVVVLVLLHLQANHRVFSLLTEIFAHSRAAQALFARWERLASEELVQMQQELDRRHSRRKQQRDESLSKASAEYRDRMDELLNWRHAEVQRWQSQAAARRVQLEEGRNAQLSQLSETAKTARFALQQRREQLLGEFEAAHQQRLREIEDSFKSDWTALQQTWTTGLSEVTQQANAWQAAVRATCPPWSEGTRTASSQCASDVLLGELRVALAAVEQGPPRHPSLQVETTEWTLPAALNLREHSACVLRYRDAAGRKAAVELLQATALRLLTVLPPGQARVTILDPLSLGENFATFMHLADFDELLISSRIWTEAHHIEERLAELTEHMETVLQMFLRNEFATLEEYNQQAGEVAEPYRILVVSGLPTNFSETALRRLWNIVASGARCGVITLIGVDTQQALPRGFELSELEAVSQVLAWDGSTFRFQLPELKRWAVRHERPPEPAQFSALIKQLGREAGDVRRVEVPFERVAPTDQAVWTRSSAKGLDVPIGRSGATRTQQLSLGSGTSQHVLIAGKTGSGKSTLLHALITNVALHYSPDELALYLIDFKKGVEFKVYARCRLPHARVVGIESDREFGVATLERLDWELQQRSAVFREEGVADLAGYRRARPHAPLPRILLVIDEFQEFFVEDDPLSQTAALLLDRLIRQGRAFGVHVILGSQTLAGAYSLARSTLGQVAVRIALQCSEADAHLILSEENTAARLLTRPGEAIYNDANGLPAGNHLFQVVWLDDETKERYLRQLAARPLPHQAAAPAIVFEGNVPADLRQLPTTRRSATDRQQLTASLGEAVSLRGALELPFAYNAGNHLLVVGQDEAAATGTLIGAAVSVLMNAADQDIELQIFNGSPGESSQRAWDQLAATFPQAQTRALERLDATLSAWTDEIRSRDGRPGPRRFLVLFDLSRFRKLRRKDDDFGFGGFEKKEATPSDNLAEILRDGPAVGLHVLIWCDSANTVSRWLSREMQQQLENRVIFAMNASDSSALIDSPAGARLGANRAWLYRGDRGTLDKFRPYSAPQPGTLEQLALAHREAAPKADLPPDTPPSVIATPDDEAARSP